MFKKCLSLIFIGLLTFAANLQTISAQSNTDKTLEKIKTSVNQRGTGEKSKVVVKMKDGTKLKGHISQILEDSFDLTDSKTKQTIAVAYRDVAQVKKPGLSTGAKIAIGIGIGAAVTGVILAVAVRGVVDNLGDISTNR